MGDVFIYIWKLIRFLWKYQSLEKSSKHKAWQNVMQTLRAKSFGHFNYTHFYGDNVLLSQFQSKIVFRYAFTNIISSIGMLYAQL